jgi:Ca2+-binding EF-hand superfamily protein
MILIAALLSFWTPFWISKEEQQQRIKIEKDCFFIQNICFRDYDFAYIDRDQSLLVSFQEAKLYRLELFLETDKNSDGKISEAEFLIASRDLAFKPACSEKWVVESYENKIRKEFNKFDLNMDMRITSQELENYGSQIFDEIDVNDDNAVSIKELKEFNASLN